MNNLCVSEAAVKLLFDYPFWVELYYTMKVVEDSTIPTLQTDGKTMWVNPEFFNGLAFDYRVSALAHETCHKMLLHPTRGRHHKNPWRNIAMDILVNQMLKDNGFKIHPGWVQPEERFRGWTYEAIYYALIEEHQKEPPTPPATQPPPEEDEEQEQGKGEAGDGPEGEEEPSEDDLEEQAESDAKEKVDGEDETNVEGDQEGDEEGEPQDGAGDEEGEEEAEGDSAGGAGNDADDADVPEKYKGAWDDVKPFEGSDAQAEAFEEKVIEQVEQALETARGMGRAPKGMEGEVKKLGTPPEEQWYDHLRRYFQELRVGEYNWYKLNRMMAVIFRIVAPTQFTEQMGPVVIFRDASGSCMSPYLQGEFTDHVNSILTEAHPSTTYVADFEMGVTAIEEVAPGEMEFSKRPRGGGGTDFSDLFDYLEREGIVPHVAIVLTDMYGTFPQHEPDYPVIWASITPGVEAPFGETIHIKTKGRLA